MTNPFDGPMDNPWVRAETNDLYRALIPRKLGTGEIERLFLAAGGVPGELVVPAGEKDLWRQVINFLTNTAGGLLTLCTRLLEDHPDLTDVRVAAQAMLDARSAGEKPNPPGNPTTSDSANLEMSGLDPRRIALVVATSTNAAERVATGYFLTGDLVLTARYVANLPNSDIRVRADMDGIAKDGDPWSDATPCWIGTGDVDAMLLRTKWFQDWPLPPLCESTADRERDWSSHGYAGAAVGEDDRKPLPLSGKFSGSAGPGDPELSLLTDQDVAKDWENHWKGISGAPIFSAGEGAAELVGIITDADITDADNGMSNRLLGLPAARLLGDINFRLTINPGFLGPLPPAPWCLLLTREGSPSELFGRVRTVLKGLRDNQAPGLHPEPIPVCALEAIASVDNWAATVRALSHADFVIADVTSFQPAVMLLLGIRSVLRRGVTVSITSKPMESMFPASAHEFASGSANQAGRIRDPREKIPFNVQETKVISYHKPHEFRNDLRDAMAEGATNLERDSNYLDLPAYHGVRAPRPEKWAEDNRKNLLVLCPFGHEYSAFFHDELSQNVEAYTGGRKPQRMLDLKSPRLVGQALYEQIRWASHCLVDWTGWSPNVFFELGVRLACSAHDPLCIIQRSDSSQGSGDVESGSGHSEKQQTLLRTLLNPVEYDPAQPEEEVLLGALQNWSNPHATGEPLPPAATFEIAQASFLWEHDATLTRPHIELRAGAERIVGKDPLLQAERLILFADNKRFDSELQAVVRERWIATWLYLQHLTASDTCPEDIHKQFVRVGEFAVRAIGESADPRHVSLRENIQEFLRDARSRRRNRERDSGDG